MKLPVECLRLQQGECVAIESEAKHRDQNITLFANEIVVRAVGEHLHFVVHAKSSGQSYFEIPYLDDVNVVIAALANFTLREIQSHKLVANVAERVVLVQDDLQIKTCIF